MKRCIVTGATGFIGAALCEELLAQGDEVYALIRTHSVRKDKLLALPSQERLRIYEISLGEIEHFVEEESLSADIFFHLAWNGASGGEREDFAIQESNLSYVAGCLRAAVACGCTKFVGAGSQAEYGVVHGKATEAATVPLPFMMYGATKNAAWQMGRVLASQLGITFVWPRIYSVYGVGENPGTLVNYVIDCLRKGRVPELSPCENMWNFLYVTDCAKILAALGKAQATEGIYHVASDDTRPLKEFVAEIRDRVSPGAELGFGMREANTEKTFWLEPDVSRLEDILPMEYISFAEGIRRKLEIV